MSRPVEQALNNLIPRHPGTLPPELIELARTLLAQSRTVASTLKAEEEIGRTYACANIACERLKTTLDLPPIEPRPPIPPRVYAKLYGYFDRVLSSTRRKSQSNLNSSAQNSPTKSKPAPSSTPQSRILPQKQTPSKEVSLDTFRQNRTPKAGLKYGSIAERDGRISRWIEPVIRKMCIELDTRSAIPHVLAGVGSILRLPVHTQTMADREAGKLKMQPGEKIPALIAAVWLFVIQRLTNTDTSPQLYKERRTKVLDLFRGVRKDEKLERKMIANGDMKDGVENAWKGWEIVDPRDVKGWVVEITEGGLLDMDWFTNIGEEEDEEEELIVGKQILGKRKEMGRGMQGEYDYLSQENIEGYTRWKEAILSRIDDLVKGGIMNESRNTTEVEDESSELS